MTRAMAGLALALVACAKDIRVADSGEPADDARIEDASIEDHPPLDSGDHGDTGAMDLGTDAGIDSGADAGDLGVDSGCVQQCGARRCGPDPVCGLPCGMCGDTESCLSDGSCFAECAPGTSQCTNDGFGYQPCGLNDILGARDLGGRVGCAAGAACGADGRCARDACLPVQVMLVVDRSASLSGNSAWVWVKDEVVAAVGARENVGSYGLRTFPFGNCQAGAALAATGHSKDTIAAAITAPDANASSPIAAALNGIENGFSGGDDGRAVFLLTDGGDSCSPSSESEAIVSRLHRSGVRTYTFALSPSADRSLLDRLALLGGTGTATRAYDAATLRRSLSAALADLGACQNPHGRVAVGGYHSCATYPDGHIACWGRNLSQQLEAPLVGVFHPIAAATDATCAIGADEHVSCWGRNDHGEIIAPTTGTFVEITGGDSHFCALRRDGTVACWGNNDSRQATPPAGETFTHITAGGFFTCGIRADDTVTCWGSGAGLSGGYKQIDAGSFSMCGITLDDALVCSSNPNPPLGSFVRVSDGDEHGCGVRNTGEIVCWGSDFMGMSTPPSTGFFVDVDAGYEHTCAVRDDDRIFCFGADFDGQSTPP